MSKLNFKPPMRSNKNSLKPHQLKRYGVFAHTLPTLALMKNNRKPLHTPAVSSSRRQSRTNIIFILSVCFHHFLYKKKKTIQRENKMNFFLKLNQPTQLDTKVNRTWDLEEEHTPRSQVNATNKMKLFFFLQEIKWNLFCYKRK